LADETKITSGSLIPAEKVNGTNVYNRRGRLPWHWRQALAAAL
jgi:hypothetical protein